MTARIAQIVENPDFLECRSGNGAAVVDGMSTSKPGSPVLKKACPGPGQQQTCFWGAGFSLIAACFCISRLQGGLPHPNEHVSPTSSVLGVGVSGLHSLILLAEAWLLGHVSCQPRANPAVMAG